MNLGMKIMIKMPFTSSLIEEMLFSPNYLEHLMISSGFECICKYDMNNVQTHGNLINSRKLVEM
jgi:hypothetical protein